MEKNRIQIHTVKDRLNFALHASANIALLGASVIATGYSHYAHSSGSRTGRVLLAALPAIAGIMTSTGTAVASAKFQQRQSAAKCFEECYPHCPDIREAEKGGFLDRSITEISKRLGLKKPPELYVASGYIYDNAVGAFTDLIIKRVAVTKGFTHFDRREQAAILSHEIAHIKAGHLVKSAVINGAALATGATFLWNAALPGQTGAGFWVPLLSTIGAACGTFFVSKLVVCSYSRAAEYQADHIAAQVTSPALMADALHNSRTVQISMFGPTPESAEWRSSYPPTPKRIARLRAMQKPLK